MRKSSLNLEANCNGYTFKRMLDYHTQYPYPVCGGGESAPTKERESKTMEYNNNANEGNRLLERLHETEKEANRRAKEYEETIVLLEGKLAAAQEHKERIALNWDRRTRELESLQDYLAELIRDGDIDDRDIIETLASQHGVRAMRKVAVTIEVTTSAVIEIPYSADVDKYSFDLDGITYDGENLDLDDESFKIIDEEDVI